MITPTRRSEFCLPYLCPILMGIFFAAAPTSAQSPTDWPRFLGKAFNNVGVTGDHVFDWSSEPELVWALPVGDGYGLGSVVGNRYFQFDADTRSESERLRCIDFESGKTLWQSLTPMFYRDMLGYESGPRSTPTVHDDFVYTFGVTGRLICRKVSSGEKVWSVDTSRDFDVVTNFFGVGGSPLIVDDKLIVPVGGSPKEDQQIPPGVLTRVSPAGSALVAFDRSDGKVIWKSGEDLSSYSSPRTAVIGGKTVILYFARDHLMAFDPDDGTVLWKVHHRAEINESVNGMVPVVDQDRIFISECYQVGSMLLDASTEPPAVVWKDPDGNRRIQSMRCHWSTPILVDGYLYGGSGRNPPDSDIRCIDFATGKVMWTEPQRVRSSVAKAGDHLLIWTERGRLQVIKPDPAKMRVVADWDFSEPGGDGKVRPGLDFPCWAAPIVVGDKLLLRGDRYVLCLRLKTSS